jgi:hypothetical protein
MIIKLNVFKMEDGVSTYDAVNTVLHIVGIGGCTKC